MAWIYVFMGITCSYNFYLYKHFLTKENKYRAVLKD